ncbi:MAG: patatin-like phospholipase family protein [Daejeonella sp.]|uniref:patatin-like phospholipase family protein n=1 Tax=Daejeonella sp. TaxID=2805397 RepID=UPI002736EADB|nr:patatin-like phospholipase family protein [Daejeonella sp.]MDP3469106.1 patatin-like phospholipase family protein [Daejeonella sp.]
MKKILSIDGGGIRGLIPGQILVALEKKLQQKSKDPQARIATYFDFFAGTSTGGILTCLLLCPDEQDPEKPKFSAEEAVDLYKRYGDKIFRVSFLSKLLNYKSLFSEKYSASHLEEVLLTYFRNKRLSELLKPCLITAYDIQERKTHFFASHDYARKGDGGDFYLKDVCRATSAAPTYFEAALVKSISGVSYPMIDGGIFANNPSLCAYSEVRNSAGDPSAKDMLILSLGTGGENRSYAYQKAKDWGALGWIKPSIDIMMSGAAETTHYHLVKMFGVDRNDANYCRIQPEHLRNAVPEMDNASQQNMQALIELGIKTAQDNSEKLDSIVEGIYEDRDSVVFE